MNDFKNFLWIVLPSSAYLGTYLHVVNKTNESMLLTMLSSNHLFRASRLFRQSHPFASISVCHLRTGRTDKGGQTQVLADKNEGDEYSRIDDLFKRINNKIQDNPSMRNFAVIHLSGSQHVIHPYDIILIKNWMPIGVGERIKLEKCLMVGNEDFTLFGRPLLNRDLVHVEATVVEKTMTNTYFNTFVIRRCHKYRRWRFARYPLTMLRINEICICHKLNESQTQLKWMPIMLIE